jgi:hypothetical protein
MRNGCSLTIWKKVDFLEMKSPTWVEIVSTLSSGILGLPGLNRAGLMPSWMMG